jgi:hypothetical protein
MLALPHYRRDTAMRPRSFGTIKKFPRRMAAEKLSRLRLPYQIIATCSMMCSGSGRSTMQEVAAPKIQATKPRIKRSRDISVTRPIEAASQFPKSNPRRKNHG